MTGVFQLVRRFLKDRRGSLLVESGIMIAVISMITLSGVELARYTLLHQKMERIAASIGDLIAQAPTISNADVVNIFDAIEEVAKPFQMGPNGMVIVSSIGASDGSGPILNWQRNGGGGLVSTSQIGSTEGAVANLPAGLTLIDGETIIVAEVFYTYTPWIYDGLVSNSSIYHTAFFRPRLGSLTTISP